MIFRYTVSQPSDGTDFRVSFPLPQVGNYTLLYPVTIQSDEMVGFSLPDGDGDRTPSDFRVITTAPLNNGDVVEFQVRP